MLNEKDGSREALPALRERLRRELCQTLGRDDVEKELQQELSIAFDWSLWRELEQDLSAKDVDYFKVEFDVQDDDVRVSEFCFMCADCAAGPIVDLGKDSWRLKAKVAEVVSAFLLMRCGKHVSGSGATGSLRVAFGPKLQITVDMTKRVTLSEEFPIEIVVS